MSDTFETLIATAPKDRDEAWEKKFLSVLPSARVKVLAPEPRQGPDSWPYLMVSTEDGADEPISNVLSWLSTKGIGLAINPQKIAPDYVLTYGMVWNFRERGEFVSAAPRLSSGAIYLRDGQNRQEVLTGPPSESYWPSYARSIVKQFLLDQGVFAPKVLMVSFDKTNYDLCFSLESLKSPTEAERAGIAEALSWFLPAHYAVSLVSEKSIPGFQSL